MKKYANPAQYFNSNYFVEINENLCSGCGECIPRFHLEANKINDNGVSEVNLGYCIGCGVCIPTCPENARKLVKKENESIPPKGLPELYQDIAKNKALLKEKRKEDINYRRIKRIK